MSEVLVALIGALTGALAGGSVAWFVARRRARADRSWEIAFAVSGVQAEVLSAGTPDRLDGIESLEKLRADWLVAHRRFYILGQAEAADKLTSEIGSYIGLLRSYLEGEIDREALERHRRVARERVTEIMQQFSSG